MRKWISLLMTLCASYSVASDTNLQFFAGYRHDDLNWSVQAPARCPTIKISSDLDEIDVFALGLRLRSNLGCNFYGRASFDIGWVLDGDITDKTRLFDAEETFIRPNVEFFAADTFETDGVIDGRFVLDADIAFGYPFYFCDCQAYIAPVIGYAFSEQYITNDGDAIFDAEYPDVSHEGCCTEKFIAKWYGPFLGLDFNYDPCSCWQTYGSVEYHWLNSKIKRQGSNGFDFTNNWDHHHRNSRGWVFNLGIAYDWCHCWAVGLDFVYRDYSAHRHHRFCSDEFYTEDGSSDEFKTSAKWRSWQLAAVIERGF